MEKKVFFIIKKFIFTIKKIYKYIYKLGRLRGNLTGKRVDFCARSVISPDSNIDLDEIGVPLPIILSLTIPVKVKSYNYNEMCKIINIGYGKLGGAKYIERKKCKNNGKWMIDKWDLRYCNDLQLQENDVVHRYLKNGDHIIFNRQPTLHKKSMMGFKVKIMSSGLTFRLNPSITTPFNADYDGDEMNLHVPQTEEARCEISNLMHLSKQIITSQSHKPCIGLVQDAVLAWNLITSKETIITRDKFMNLLSHCKEIPKIPPPTIMKKNKETGQMEKYWTGKQLFSCLLPDIFIFKRYVRNSNPEKDEYFDLDQTDSFIDIRDGKLIRGRLCKQTLGVTSNNIVQVLCNDYDNGGYKAIDFLNISQRIGNSWLSEYGFSFLMSDCEPNLKMKQHMDCLFSGANENLKQLREFANEQKMPSFITEGVINRLLQTIRDAAYIILKRELKYNNTFNTMVSCGSKGNTINQVQMILCLGQQTCKGKWFFKKIFF